MPPLSAPHQRLGYPAKWSSCKLYRYTLWRVWGSGKRYAQFIGLNSSIANEIRNDPTLTKCISFATRFGFDGLCMTNLFALVETVRPLMKKSPSPIGRDNDHWLREICDTCELCIVAWGNDGVHLRRNEAVLQLLRGKPLHCLAFLKDGHPKHALYAKYIDEPLPFPVH